MGITLAWAPSAAIAAEPTARHDGGRGASRPVEPPAKAPADALRLATLSGAPSWLDFGLTHRQRFEWLGNQFRVGHPGDDRALMMRTTLFGAVDAGVAGAKVELIDSRFYLADSNAPVDTTMGDAIDVLQAYGMMRAEGLFGSLDTAELRAGRVTLDIGSRRLVSRNNFRNTINAFTGFDARWRGERGEGVRMFAVMPVERRPASASRLVDNAVVFDKENTHAICWGAFAESGNLLGDVSAEAYVFGLSERDSDVATHDRRLLTPGARFSRKPSPGEADLDLEGAAQMGTSRATARPDDVRDLEHMAVFAHAEIGYSAIAPWSPRVAVLYDYASGDSDAFDGKNGRFDRLFGSRRFDFGPTGIYGTFSRSNLSSPAVRLAVRPLEPVSIDATYRPAWVAQSRDAWTTSGIVDATGASGSFIGHQVDARVRWDPVASHVRVEIGAATLWLAGLATRAPNAPHNGTPIYGYLQLVLQF